jgi:CRISPR-associated protein Cas1
MLRRIVEIEGEGRRLTLQRGFLNVSGPEGLLGQVPLDDVEAVIASSPAVTCTNQVLAALAARGAPVVICGNNFTPAAFLLPVSGHHAQGHRVEAQAAATRPSKKRLWSEIVRAKLRAQAAALERVGENPLIVRSLVSRVRSGDPANLEAQAAQRYLPALFGKGFTRDRDAAGVNACLNYGYTVLRAATARAVVAAGLHPSLGLHHKSKGDALRLADDLMEPFRPAVDLIARDIHQEKITTLDATLKRRLVAVLRADYDTEEDVTTLSNALCRLAQSLAQVHLGGCRKLALPRSPIPLPPSAICSPSTDGYE